ncbi:MAG: site-specific DNA-methyltransferase, partial [Anaerolineae bacterium]|nr:site-specific DNA-methyltransferase [Anaerolineae bacterium]
MTDQPNRLFYGDNLDILRDRSYFPNACVDLIYLDPPFNSARSYNVLFKDETGRSSDAQITAFEDTWHWGEESERLYHDLVTHAPPRLSNTISAFRTIVGTNQMMAYLVMMAARLAELHRVLKPTGSLYLHCDPTASHYLKIILDAIFGAENFRNEIIWKRTTTHSDAKRWSPVSDTLLYYTKSDTFTWNTQFTSHDDGYISGKYRYDDGDGRGLYRLDNMTSPNPRPNLTYEWQGFAPPKNGWRYAKETMQRLHDEGRISYPEAKNRRPQLKRYLNEMSGRIADNIWA